jgi:hypothetical protein
MTLPLAHPTFPVAQFAPAPAVFYGGSRTDFTELMDTSQLKSTQIRGSAAVMMNEPPDAPIQVTPRISRTVVRPIRHQTSYAERLFDCLVSLKVAASQYAMHLSPQELHRIFDRLDSVINVEDWHEDDKLPHLDSFRNFLKWMIYSKDFSWSSIGVSNEGNILVAWSRPNLVLTANFSTQNKLTWTAALETEHGLAHAVGTCSLQHFAKQAFFYLGSS